MFQTFRNAWKVPDLKKKILFTLMILLLYRIGANLYIPYVNVEAISGTMNFAEKFGGLLYMFSMFSGEGFSQASFFALSVSPYITASIVMQLLTIALPPLERLSKQGEEGRKKITAITRWVTIGLAIITAYGYVVLLHNNSFIDFGMTQEWFGWIVMIASLCAGAAVIMWLAEQINDHGIGNGISMILFANIISGFTSTVFQMSTMVKSPTGDITTGWYKGGQLAGGIIGIVVSIALSLGAIMLIVWFTNSERRIPIQYAKRVVGRKMYGGQSSNLPLKMNMAGVMPVIFASSITALPGTVAGFLDAANKAPGFVAWVEKWFSPTSVPYILIFTVLVFLFSYFYIMISFNPVEVANNIRNNGGSIPGIRPGKPTSDYIKKILNRITLMGAVFLIVIAVLPMAVTAITSAFNYPFASLAFMGTSLLIVVGVALETVRDIEAQLAMRNYKGFLD